MSRTKEAVVVLLDAGFTMNTPLKEQIHIKSLTKKDSQPKKLTRFDAAIATVQSLVNQKIFYKPKDEISVVLYGTQDTNNQLNEEGEEEDDYTNVSVLSHFDIPTVDLIKKLVPLEPTKDPTVKVDILDGLIVALDLLFRRTNNKKYVRKLLVITDAASRINDAQDMEKIIEMIQQMEVQVQIIGIDFDQVEKTKKEKVKQEDTGAMKKEPAFNTSVKTEQEEIHIIKQENEKMLMSIAKEVHGDVKSVSKRIDMLTQGNKRAVSQVTKFRGHLEIGTTMGIPVFCYLKTKIATLPTLKKESQVSHDKTVSGRVKMDRMYRSAGGPQQEQEEEEVPPERRVKAFRYGPEKVPFSSADMESLKFQTEKSLKLLGFVDKSQLNPAQLVGGTDIFVAEPNKPSAATALASLVQAMIESSVVAIARFVARKNAAPKIIALVPHLPNESENFHCFYGLQLPFEEDLRAYEFGNLLTKKNLPSDEQQALADRLVDSLSIKEEKESEYGACFNPCIVRFFQAVQDRALDPNASIPPLPDYVDRCLSIDYKRLEQIHDVVDAFDKGFQLKEALLKAKDRKKKTFWSDTTTLDDLKQEGAGVVSIKIEGEADEAQQDECRDEDSDLDLDELLEGGEVTSVGSMNPISDFEAMVESKQPIKIRTAVHGIQAQIENFITNGKQFYPKAIQTLRHFRLKSPELQCSSQFNDHLAMIKSKFHETDVWKALQDAQVTLLTNEEDPSVSTTSIQAKVFLYGEEELEAAGASASIPSQLETMTAEEEDMFADFE